MIKKSKFLIFGILEAFALGVCSFSLLNASRNSIETRAISTTTLLLEVDEANAKVRNGTDDDSLVTADSFNLAGVLYQLILRMA